MKITVKSNVKDIMQFAMLIPNRMKHFKNGSEKPIPKTYRVNETAKLLHPKEQLLKVTAIEELSADVKCFTFASAGDKPLAFARAGQYICLRLDIGDSVVSRPYSLCSSPADSVNGIYKIAVKLVGEGFVSGYILENFKVGDVVKASAPEGTFCYEPLRDAAHVIGVAGGSGITPFISFMKAVSNGDEDMNFTLIYGAKTENDLLFKAEIDKLTEGSDKLNAVYVLSGSDAEGYEHGFITKELIEKYAPDNYSVFLCGPNAMYNFVGGELKKMNLRRKNIRFEVFGEMKHPEALPGFPAEAADKTFSCKVISRGEELATIPCKSNESLLTAIERSGILVNSSCRSGECGLCRSKLISGEVFIPDETEHRREGDIKYGYIHPCCTYPTGDVVIGI